MKRRLLVLAVGGAAGLVSYLAGLSRFEGFCAGVATYAIARIVGYVPPPAASARRRPADEAMRDPAGH